jgi:hypothetical protein
LLWRCAAFFRVAISVIRSQVPDSRKNDASHAAARVSEPPYDLATDSCCKRLATPEPLVACAAGAHHHCEELHSCSNMHVRRGDSNSNRSRCTRSCAKWGAYCYPKGCAAPGSVQWQCHARGPLSKLERAPPQRKINVTSKSPVGDISVVTLIRTDTTLDHSQKAEKV